jgi:hypothetical protein
LVLQILQFGPTNYRTKFDWGTASGVPANKVSKGEKRRVGKGNKIKIK